MLFRCILAVIVLSLVPGVRPVAAAITPIDPTNPPAPVLDPAELAKLTALRTTIEPQLWSAVGPDDSTVAILARPDGESSAPPQLMFLDVRDGSSRAFDPPFLAWEPMLPDLGWRDEHTVVYLAASEATGPVLVTLDRRTGALATSAVPLPGQPLSLAPDASRLLLEVAGGDEATLAVYDLATGHLMPLLSYPQGGRPAHWAWTRDATKLALVRLVLPPEMVGNPEFIAQVLRQDALGALPPAQNPLFQGNVVDVFDLAGGAFRPAALRARDGDGYAFDRVGWSTDGQTLLTQVGRAPKLAGRQYPVYRDRDRTYLRFYDAQLRQSGALDRAEIAAPHAATARFVSPDELIVAAPAGATYRLYYHNRVSGEFRALPVPDGTVAEGPHGHQLAATRHSRRLVFVHSSFQAPPELYRIGWDGTGFRALTAFNAAAATANRVRVDAVSVPIGGGARRAGYLVQPAGAAFPPRNVRLVVYQQGGPGGAMTNRWAMTAEEPFSLLPNFGIAVLVVPLAGREGFGPAFYNLLKDGRNFGQRDVDEAAQVVAHLIRRGYTARDRVGITGGSYGGYFASQSIAHHPGLYAAANAQSAILDLAHTFEAIAPDDVAYWEGRLPADDPGEYCRDSPLEQAARIRTPLLLFHGDQDRLPIASAADFHDRVAATGTPVELLAFQGEGHGLSLPSSHMTAAQAQIVWFRTHLAVGR